MSEQQAEATQGESGSVGAGSTVSHPTEAAAAMAMSVLESPAIAPDHEAPPKAEPVKADVPKAEAAKAEASKGGGKVLIMAPGDRTWRDHLNQAQAVLHTMREPDEAMAAVGDVATWRNMVEAAIAQKVD